VEKKFKLDVEFATAQAVTPGQGQTVDISGVQVGRVSGVHLRNGRAVVSTEIKPRYAHIYPNAHVLLRPKTGLKDMVLELDPGTPSSGPELRSGATIAVSNTLPDVDLDEVLAGLETSGKRAFMSMLARLHAEWNIAMVVIEHDIETISRLCHRAVVLNFGKVIADGTPDAVFRDPEVRRSYTGTGHTNA
jgi:ABC-type glutathione transport system ATPase component